MAEGGVMRKNLKIWFWDFTQVIFQNLVKNFSKKIFCGGFKQFKKLKKNFEIFSEKFVNKFYNR